MIINSKIRIENYKLDPAECSPLILGGNPYTLDDNRQKFGFFKRLKDMDSLISLHNYYGLWQPECGKKSYRQEDDNAISKERYIYDLYQNTNKKDK